MISLFALVSTTARSSWYQHQPPLSLNWILVPTTASLPLGSVTVGAAQATWPPVPVVPATPVVPPVPALPLVPAVPAPVPAVPVPLPGDEPPHDASNRAQRGRVREEILIRRWVMVRAPDALRLTRSKARAPGRGSRRRCA